MPKTIRTRSRRSESGTAVRAWLVNATVAAVSVLVALLLAEGALRVTGFSPGNPLARLINHRDAWLGYRMVPGMRESIQGPGGLYTAETVSLGFPDGIGFRDDGIQPPVDSVFIGDSFVWGYGVELADTVSERYERLVGRDAVNLGMTSWTSPTQYERILSRYGAPLRPKIAFVEALVENDFGDLGNFADWSVSGTEKSYPEWMTDRVMQYSPDTLSYRLRRFLYDRTALGRFIADRVQFGMGDQVSPAARGLVHVTGPALDLWLDPRQLAGAEPDSAQVARFRAALQALQQTAAQNGIRLIVFVVPSKEMVYQDRFTDPSLRKAIDWRYAALLELLPAAGIEQVDLLAPLRAAAARGEQVYFDFDTHWTPRGHEIAAQVLRAAADRAPHP